MLEEVLRRVPLAPTPGHTGGPSITPPSVHGFHVDPKVVGFGIGAILLTIFAVKVWNALPKWLLIVVVLGVLAAIGFATFHLGGTTADKTGIHR